MEDFISLGRKEQLVLSDYIYSQLYIAGLYSYFDDMQRAEAQHNIVKALQGYSDWIGAKIYRQFQSLELLAPGATSANTITVDTPNLTAKDISSISEAYDVDANVIGMVVYFLLHKDTILPFIGTTRSGQILVNVTALRTWALHFDWL